MSENQLDSQILEIFDSLRVENEEFRNLFREQLREAANWALAKANDEDKSLKKRHAEMVRLQQQLLNLRLLEEINSSRFAAKSRELRDEEAELKQEMEQSSRSRHQMIDPAIKTFELSQSLRQQ